MVGGYWLQVLGSRWGEGLEGGADTAGVGEEMVGLVGGAEMVGEEVGLTFRRQGFKGA